jgi:membrane protease YdiL (CAAX protease family)
MISLKIKNIIIGYFLCLIWIIFISYLYNILGHYEIIEESEQSDSFYYSIFLVCIWAPIWEEALYRYGPLTIAKNIDNQHVIPVAIIASCIFGWGHGESHEGVLVQGVLGLIFSIVYIKNNFCYFSSVLLHSLYNTTLVILENI